MNRKMDNLEMMQARDESVDKPDYDESSDKGDEGASDESGNYL